MPICNLCKKNEADKMGSHMIPHFLMKRIDGFGGSIYRDKELGFSIKKNETTTYFGRSVLPEELASVHGELSDEDIDKNEIPQIIDNFFCSECESKLAVIENQYATTLEEDKEESNIPSEIAYLFWISLLWRVSASGIFGLKLTEKEENRLNRVLNRHLQLKKEELNLDDIRNDQDAQSFGYRLIRSPKYSDKEGTFLYCHQSHKMPYTILVDEYVLFFYFRKKQIDGIKQSFFGFEDKIVGKTVNSVSEGETRILLDEKEFGTNMQKLIDSIVKKRFNHYEWLCDEVHKKMGGRGPTMPLVLKRSIFTRLTTDDTKIADRYTLEHFIQCMYTEIELFNKSGT